MAALLTHVKACVTMASSYGSVRVLSCRCRYLRTTTRRRRYLFNQFVVQSLDTVYVLGGAFLGVGRAHLEGSLQALADGVQADDHVRRVADAAAGIARLPTPTTTTKEEHWQRFTSTRRSKDELTNRRSNGNEYTSVSWKLPSSFW